MIYIIIRRGYEGLLVWRTEYWGSISYTEIKVSLHLSKHSGGQYHWIQAKMYTPYSVLNRAISVATLLANGVFSRIFICLNSGISISMDKAKEQSSLCFCEYWAWSSGLFSY